MEKLSIIIPAYNSENCIERCLNSILDQQFNNEIEIIVVNDGSTDSTGKILHRYEKEYPGLFRIVTKENGGASSARNLGLSIASGDWVWFCDSDDYIVKNGMSYVLDNFVDESIDICTFYMTTLDSIALKSFKEQDKIEASCYFDGSSLMGYKLKTYYFDCDHLYRLSAIKDIRFYDTTMVEDMLFNLEAYRRDLRLRCTNANIYRYTISENQLTRKRDPISMRSAVRGYEYLFNYIKGIQELEGTKDPSLSDSLDEMILGQFQPFISRVLSSDLKTSEFKGLFERLKQSGVFPLEEVNKKNRVFNFIGNHPSLFPAMKFLHTKVILPYILPRLSRN